MAHIYPRVRERRQRPRTQTAYDVYVSLPGLLSLRRRLTNLSASGAFIEVGPLRLRNGRRLELALVVDHGLVAKMYRRSAVVVRRSPEGVGVLFLAKGARNDGPG